MSTPNYKCNEINAKGHLKAWIGGPHGWKKRNSSQNL